MIARTFLVVALLSSQAGAGTFDVRAHGAVGDGIADDTAAINAAIAAAAGQAQDATVVFPEGTYRTSGHVVPANVSLRGSGAKVKAIPAPGEVVRLFSYLWDSDVDSPPVLVSGLAFDLSLPEMPPDTKHKQALFLQGQSPATWKAGRLNVSVTDCSVADSGMDGFYVHHGVTVTFKRIEGRNIARGLITITGKDADVAANNVSGIGCPPPGIDVEPNDRAHAVKVRLSNVQLAGKLDLALTKGSTFTGRNIEAHSPLYLLNLGESCVISDSVFHCVEPYEVRIAGRSVFRDCTFNVSGDAGMQVMWRLPDLDPKNQTLTLDRCKFVGVGARAADKLIAIEAAKSEPGSGNAVILRDSQANIEVR